MNINYILLLITLYLYGVIHPSTKAIVRVASYNAIPLCTFDLLIQRPGTFKDLCKMDLDIFISFVIELLADWIKLPRGYLLRDDYQQTGTCSRLRRCQISKIDRIVRCMLRLRLIPFDLLAHYYDQDRTTVNRDFHHICLLITERLSPFTNTYSTN